MTIRLEECKVNLARLLNGQDRPSSVLGRTSGYKYPKSVASGWLRKEIHNAENPNSKVGAVYVSTSGNAFKSESLAMKSKVYQSIIRGTYKAINNFTISDYGVMPAPGGDGYMVFSA